MSGTVGGSTYVLTFQNQSVVQGMAQTQQMVAQSSAAIAASLNQIIAALNATTTAAGNTSGAITGGMGGGIRGAITAAAGGSGGMVASLVTLSTGLGVATFALREIREALNFVGEGVIGFNDKLAKSHLVWEVFTGDTKAADEEVQALFEFSRKTPFTFEQVDAAARQLAAFGGVAFASQENLTLLGNVAAGTQKPLQTITYEFGQMYQEIENGQPFGRAARALVMFGALSAETRTELEKMQKAGASTDEMLKLFTDDLERFNGLIEKQATETLSGAMTTLTDTVQSLIAVGGESIFDALIEGVTGLNKVAESDAAFVWAKNVGVAIKEVILDLQAIINAVRIFIDLMQGLWTSLAIIVGEGISKALRFMGELVPGMDKVADGIDEGVKVLKASLNSINADFQQQGDDLIKALTTENKWAEGGEKAATAFKTGFDRKITGSSDEADQIARDYMTGVTAAFSHMNLDQIKATGDLDSFVSTLLLGAGKDPEGIMQELKPQIMAAITGLHDDVNMGLVQLQRVLPPEVYAQVEKYIEALRQADMATQGLAAATNVLNTAETNYTNTVKEAKIAMDAANDAVEKAKNTRTANAQGFQDQIEAQNIALNGLRQQGEDESIRLQGIVRDAQNALNQLSETVAQHAREDAARIDAQQKVVDQRQALATEHEEAFSAILAGETERFLDQKGAIDATTQAILDRYNAEVEGKIRAAAGDDQRVTRLEREERAKLLELDTHIRQLRSQGHFKEADDLQKQRDRIAAYYDDQIKYASQVAAVSKDKADEAKERVNEAAKDSADKDKKDVDAATKVLDNIKTEAAARAEADRIALAGAKARVEQAQEEARISAEDFKQRERDIQQNIISIKAQAAEQKVRDDAAVAGAIAAKNIVDTIWTNAVAESKTAVDNAKNGVTAAKDTKTAMDEQLTTMQKITAEWEKQYKYALGILNAERESLGLKPLETIPTAPTAPQSDKNPNPAVGLTGGLPDNTGSTPPAKPAAQPGVNPNPPVGPTPGRDNPHFLAPMIPGFTPTTDRPYPDGTWWDPKNGFVPEGYEVRDGDVLYWVGKGGETYTPPPLGGPGEKSQIASPISAMVSGQTPGMLRTSGLSAGMFGVTSPSAGGASQGDRIGSLHILEGAFANTTIDSPQRAEEVRFQIVAGVRQALNDHVAAGSESRIGRKM